MLADVARGLRNLVYPAICARCEELLPSDDLDFCPDCCQALTHDPEHCCPRCSSSVGEFAASAAGCPRCRDDRFHFEGVRRLGPYQGVLAELILAMKHPAGESLAGCLGRLWASSRREELQSLGIDLVMPVPLHWWRRLRRGHNSAAGLASAVASQLALDYAGSVLRRTRATPSQVLLTPAQRRTNVKGAFRVRSGADVRGRKVLLIDDVLTTGSTASEAARVLREAGATQVWVGVLAHR